MSMPRPSLLVVLALACGPAAARAQAPAPSPLVVQAPLHWTQHCASCHEAADSRAPSRDALSQRSTEAIYAALTKGAMAVNASALNDSQKQAMAI
ncbi:MAG: hypothetical protein AB7I25_06755, partial [Vicinamibacterales bacterium]